MAKSGVRYLYMRWFLNLSCENSGKLRAIYKTL
jgi:hypothetical protein